jgi:hypothetical protein
VGGVQQWAEIRRLVLVEGRSQREMALRMGLARDAVAKAAHSETPAKYTRMPVGSKFGSVQGLGLRAGARGSDVNLGPAAVAPHAAQFAALLT